MKKKRVRKMKRNVVVSGAIVNKARLSQVLIDTENALFQTKSSFLQDIASARSNLASAEVHVDDIMRQLLLLEHAISRLRTKRVVDDSDL